MLYALIVEDEQIQASIAQNHLAELGFHTAVAHSIEQARAYLPHALDLALIDINLPDGSGLDFAREMRAHEKHSDTDVIVASIDDGIPNVNRAYDDARAITFVSKPIRWRDLVQLLRAIHAERVLRAPNDGRSGSIAGSHAHS